MNNTPDSPAQTLDDRMTQGGNYWTLFTPGIWKDLHAVSESDEQIARLNITPADFHGEWNYTIAPRKPDR